MQHDFGGLGQEKPEKEKGVWKTGEKIMRPTRQTHRRDAHRCTLRQSREMPPRDRPSWLWWGQRDLDSS